MKVELIDKMGSDLTVVNAARVSYAKESQYEYGPVVMHEDTGERGRSKHLKSSDEGLICFLARERHGTPFEHVVFTFRVKVPIFVAREWFRHRIGSFNEVSGRYVEMEPNFYMPDVKHVRTQTGKPGAYQVEPIGDPDVVRKVLRKLEVSYCEAYADYQELLEMGVAKELARTVLPVGLETEFYWTVNLRSLTNFLSLRTAPNALQEIRDMALEVEQLVTPFVPVCMDAWNQGGRQSL